MAELFSGGVSVPVVENLADTVDCTGVRYGGGCVLAHADRGRLKGWGTVCYVFHP